MKKYLFIALMLIVAAALAVTGSDKGCGDCPGHDETEVDDCSCEGTVDDCTGDCCDCEAECDEECDCEGDCDGDCDCDSETESGCGGGGGGCGSGQGHGCGEITTDSSPCGGCPGHGS